MNTSLLSSIRLSNIPKTPSHLRKTEVESVLNCQALLEIFVLKHCSEYFTILLMALKLVT